MYVGRWQGEWYEGRVPENSLYKKEHNQMSIRFSLATLPEDT